MKPKKCPRCELNYIITEVETLCDVCRKAMGPAGEPDELENLCAECGENPAVPGQDYCLICLRSHIKQQKQMAQKDPDDDEDEEEDVISIRPVSQIDTIDIEDMDDIPPDELEQIQDELDDDDDDDQSFAGDDEEESDDFNEDESD